jgi:hypothetical protein
MLKKTKSLIKEMMHDKVREEIKIHRAVSHTAEISCEVCGCLLPSDAASGKKEVRAVNAFTDWFAPEHYIYTPRYCKIHIPPKEAS